MLFFRWARFPKKKLRPGRSLKELDYKSVSLILGKLFGNINGFLRDSKNS